MSIGINLMISLLKQATSKLFAGDAIVTGSGRGSNTEGINNTHHDFDIEIIEKHHNQKLDAPSGTAIMLADAINSTLEEKMDYVYERESKMQKRSNHEIGIHSIRGGAIVGEHEVIFAGAGEVIELKHTALSRDVFGVGALKAARYMYLKPAGLYNMQDVLETE
jgi:4-hydroxy-tetrahydrodipicolinate reductase